MRKNSISISLISGTLITGITVYIVLAYLLVPTRITLPISVAFSLLSLGLVKYYSITNRSSTYTQYGNNDSNAESIDIRKDSDPLKTEPLSNIVFVSVFITALLICIFLSKPEVDNIYTSWYNLGIAGLITLAAGIILSFFLPGYALVLLLTKKYTVSPLLRILLAYLFSVLITGLTTYLSEIFFNNGTNENRTFLIGVYSILLVSFIFYHRIHRDIRGLNNHTYRLPSSSASNFVKITKNHLPEVLVFGSLLMILIIATNYLYGGITIGDQWYHQNRILLFLSGQFREYVTTNGDEIYPPLQSALLAGLTTLSGIPLVNTYAAIAFLNITAVFGFYYFCSIWFPRNTKRAALLASALFVIGSGFGWVYVFSLTDTNPISSPISSMANFVDEKIKVTDIRLSANFMIAAFPDFSTGLIYISLPTGFVLLGLVRTNIENKLHYTSILATITVLGVLSHDEFYIFIIISSTLPLIYNLEKKHSLYVGLLVAIAFTYLIDGLLPVRYFTFQSIFGIPLLLLCTIFTLVMFAMYVLRQKLKTRTRFLPRHSFEATKKISSHIRRFHLIPKGVLVAVILYLYLLCFIVWIQLPANYIDAHTQKYNTPWYLYPMRLGGIGIIGLASILSYSFKRYEKEVFVFGILIIIALLAGPYYNEQRFNKYVMVGMIGFASLLVFKLLLFMTRKRPVFNGIIVSVLVISASLSTLMYIGYNALMVQTQDYTFALDRRNFPTEKELNMFDMIRSDIKVGAKPYNVATFQNEYNLRDGGIISKLHAFAGLPYTKITQTDYLLNASTLELFYHLLEKSNTKYILIPSKSINQQTLEDPIKFALQNFPQVYRDENYIVFSIPSLHGPSTASESEAGIINIDGNNALSLAVQDQKLLHITNQVFDLEKSDKKFIYVHNESKVENTILFGYKKNGGKTLWSKDLGGGKLNYVDISFKIIGENKTGKDSAGLKWTDGKDNYFVLLSSKGLELRRQIPNQDDNILLAQNSEVKKNDGVWYELKIVNLENSIRVYVNNLLKINIHRDSLEKIPREISKIGIFSENNAVEILPIHMAKINYSAQLYEKSNNYRNYYPLSSLSLSGSKYNTFEEDDYSSLSMKTLILPFDPQSWDDTKFNRYLDYARQGGTLVVINSDHNSIGKFGKFLSIQGSNETTNFTGIASDVSQTANIDVSGTANGIAIKPSNDTNIIAYYTDSGSKEIKPLAIEKSLNNNGRIIYVIAEGYFDAIYHYPKKYFSTLANFSDFYLNSKNPITPQSTSIPIKRFIGEAELSGKITINTSSFSVVNGSTNPNNLAVEQIQIFDKNKSLKNRYENLSLSNMKLYGRYEVSIDSTGPLTFPATLSQSGYAQISLPNEFDLTLQLHDYENSGAEIIVANNSSIDTVKLANESKIVFKKIRSDMPSEFVDVITKQPIVSVNGNLKFEKTNFYGESKYPPLDVTGNATAKFGYIDHVKEPYHHGIRIQYLGYLDSIKTEGRMKQAKQELKLPGDISLEVKKRGLDVPLLNILGSSSNISLIAVIIIGTMLVTLYFRRIQNGQSSSKS